MRKYESAHGRTELRLHTYSSISISQQECPRTFSTLIFFFGIVGTEVPLPALTLVEFVVVALSSVVILTLDVVVTLPSPVVELVAFAASSSSTSISSSTVYNSSTAASAFTNEVIPDALNSNCSDTFGFPSPFSVISVANASTPVML
jgi:hypothetical protein